MLRKMLAAVMAILVLATVVLAEPNEAAAQLAGGELCSVVYSNGGNELGNVYRASIDYTEDGTLALTIEEAETWCDPVVVHRYSAAGDTLQRIAAVAEANGMVKWDGREDKMTVCDAPQPWLTLCIRNNDGGMQYVEIDGYIIFSDEEDAAYRAVLAILLENANEEHLIETYTYDRE